MTAKDLVVLLADLDAENSVRTLLEKRRKSLGIREIEFDIVRHVMRDSGCCREAGVFLRSFFRTHTHALVIFDHHGCGLDSRPVSEIEKKVEQELIRTGWGGDRIACIILDPELEIWVWADSPHVAESLGFGTDTELMRGFLEGEGLWKQKESKPREPKEAVERSLYRARRPRSARLYGDLAETVGLSSCSDPSFDKLKRVLTTWFPISAAKK